MLKSTDTGLKSTETGVVRFGPFELDRAERALRREGAQVPLNARYLDALILLVDAAGQLVTKDRFMDAVWRGVPVTDEALTQCIRTLRRALGDDAGDPRFIATVPKYGYRFVGAVAGEGPVVPPAGDAPRIDAAADAPSLWRVALGGTTGAVAAGAIGGIGYGLIGATLAAPVAGGSLSIVLVLLCITVAVAAIGGSAVALGAALAVQRAGAPSPWIVAGAALGGLAVGTVAKLLGIDAFALLLGRAPMGITGAGEGLALGLAVGIALWVAQRVRPGDARAGAMLGAACGVVAGLAIALAGGRLLAGSLDLLTQAMPGARLDPGRIGAWLGEDGFGLRSRIVSSMAEGALFVAASVAGLIRGIGRR